MIALTQEKREELANYARARLAPHVVHGGCSDEEDIFKIALASLTAEPVGYTWNRGVHCELLGVDLNDDTPIGVDLFTAPPVSEIKLPDRDKLPGWARNHEDSLDWYESEIKRLNGLGK